MSKKEIHYDSKKKKHIYVDDSIRYRGIVNGKIANDISLETGAKVLEFNAAHNISASDFDAGVTYVDIMKNNIEVLKEALN